MFLENESGSFRQEIMRLSDVPGSQLPLTMMNHPQTTLNIGMTIRRESISKVSERKKMGWAKKKKKKERSWCRDLTKAICKY